MTAPLFVAAAGKVAYAEKVTLTMPSGIQAGDLLVLFADVGGTSSARPTIADLAGWTPLGVQESGVGTGSYVVGGRVFTRIADGTETSVTVSRVGTALTDWSAQLVAYRNTAGVDVFGSASAASVTAAPTPSVTTAADQAMIVRHWAVVDNDRGCLITSPAGATERHNGSGNGSLRLQAATSDAEQATAGTSGALSAALSTNTDDALGWTVALLAGSPAPGSLAGALSPLSASLSATHTPPPPSGTLTATLAGLTGSGAGAVAPTGTLGGNLAGLSSSFVGQSILLVPTSDRYANLGGYGYAGVGQVDYDPPVAPTPARVRRVKVQRVHQSLPAPTLENGRPV